MATSKIKRMREPACRVCGCTENNACDGGCAWAKVEPGSNPLCTACEGTPADMAEVLRRIVKSVRQFGSQRVVADNAAMISRAALLRRARVAIRKAC